MFEHFRHVGGIQTRRGRRRLAVALVGVLLGGLILGEIIDMVVNSYGPADRTAKQSWLSSVSPLLTESGSLALFLHDVRSSTPDGNCTVQCALGVLVSESASEQTAYQQDRLPPQPGLGASVATALGERVSGVRALVSAVNLATGPARDIGAASAAVAQAGRDLLRADRADRSLTATLRHEHRSTPWQTDWISSPAAWGTAGAASFAAGLSHSSTLLSSDTLKFLAISLTPAPNSYPGLSAVTTTTTSTTTTTTTSPLLATGASGFVPTTSSTTTTTTATPVTTTTIALPVGFAQIPPPGVISRFSYQPPHLAVIVVVQNNSTVERQVTLSDRLDASPLGSATEQHSQLVRDIAPGSSIYVTLPELAVSTKATAFNLHVEASAPGIARSIAATIAIRIGA